MALNNLSCASRLCSILFNKSPVCNGSSVEKLLVRQISIYRCQNSARTTQLFVDPDEEEEVNLRKKHRKEALCHHSADRTFSDFPLEPKLLKRLETLGYNQPFEIQSKTLEHTLNGRNVIGRAITGSGKTLAFAIPIVQKIIENRQKPDNRPKAILISPTRELCNQIHKSVQELSTEVNCVALYGGASFNRQLHDLERGVDLICATPGRLNDHLDRGTIGLDKLQFLCLDEADELLNPNFREQIENVLENSPKEKQVMLFSATMPGDIMQLIRKFMPDPEYVDITSGQKYKSSENITHSRIEASRKLHLPILCSVLEKHYPQRCIIFLRTRDQTKRTAELIRTLNNPKLKASFINSDLSQVKREVVIKHFRKGSFNILCATDVAARGLDIPEVDMVIQVEPPSNGVDYYIHRSGRTGRAGRDGTSIMIHSSSKQEHAVIRDIEATAPLKEIPAPEGTDDMLAKLQGVAHQYLISYEMSNPYPEKLPKKQQSYSRNKFGGSMRPRFRESYTDSYNDRGAGGFRESYNDRGAGGFRDSRSNSRNSGDFRDSRNNGRNSGDNEWW